MIANWRSSVRKWEGIIQKLETGKVPEGYVFIGNWGFCRTFSCGDCPLYDKFCGESGSVFIQARNALYKRYSHNPKPHPAIKKALTLSRRILKEIKKHKDKF